MFIFFGIFDPFFCNRLYLQTSMKVNNLFFPIKDWHITTPLVVVNDLLVGPDPFFYKGFTCKT